jgi:hypothetical protein
LHRGAPLTRRSEIIKPNAAAEEPSRVAPRLFLPLGALRLPSMIFARRRGIDARRD